MSGDAEERFYLPAGVQQRLTAPTAQAQYRNAPGEYAGAYLDAALHTDKAVRRAAGHGSSPNFRRSGAVITAFLYHLDVAAPNRGVKQRFYAAGGCLKQSARPA
jgi:hypothetical protein